MEGIPLQKSLQLPGRAFCIRIKHIPRRVLLMLSDCLLISGVQFDINPFYSWRALCMLSSLSLRLYGSLALLSYLGGSPDSFLRRITLVNISSAKIFARFSYESQTCQGLWIRLHLQCLINPGEIWIHLDLQCLINLNEIWIRVDLQCLISWIFLKEWKTAALNIHPDGLACLCR